MAHNNLTKEDVEHLINKVRDRLKLIDRYSSIVKNSANISFEEDIKNNCIYLRSIRFSDGYNEILIQKNGVFYHEYRNNNWEICIKSYSYNDLFKKLDL